MRTSDTIFEEYTCNANSHINFRLIRNVDDVEKQDNIINPEFTHEFFGENENIFGYKNLNIDINFSAASFVPYVKISYDKIISDNKEMKVEDFDNGLLEQLQNIHRSRESFNENIMRENFRCFGKMIDQYQTNGETFEVYHVYGDELNKEEFKAYSNNIQYFMIFFVDGASIINITEKGWEYIIIYQKYRDGNQVDRYATVGFMTLFNYFAYPDMVRQRISQVLVLPPFQKRGHGERLLNNFYKLAIANVSVKDVTVEDPSDQFQTLRDYVDCKNTLALPSFNVDLVRRGLFKKFSNLLKTELKISNMQVVRVYEILGLKLIDRSNPIDAVKYNQAVMARLTETIGRAKELYNDGDLVNLAPGNQSILIEKEYDRLVQIYATVIVKLDK